MRHARSSSVLALAVALAFAWAGRSSPEWPQWRGPSRDGVASDPGFGDRWRRGGLRECWRRPIGDGYAGVAVRDGRAFSMEGDSDVEHLVALDARDGRALWRAVVGAVQRDVWGGVGPRVTPAVDGELVLTVGSAGELLAFAVADGAERWRRGLFRELGGRPPAEGYAASPLVEEGRVFVMPGNPDGATLAAFDRDTGELLWRAASDRTSYSSPLAWRVGGMRQILFLTGTALLGVAPDDGEVLWRYPWPTYDGVNVATPLVVGPDRVLVSAGYDQGAAVVDVRAAGRGWVAVEVWRSRVLKNHFSTSVLHRGTIFGFDQAVLVAVDATSGRQRWQARGFGKGSLIRAGDDLIVLGEDGELALVPATPESFRVDARYRGLSGPSWTPPSLASGRLYLRNHQQVACLEATS